MCRAPHTDEPLYVTRNGVEQVKPWAAGLRARTGRRHAATAESYLGAAMKRKGVARATVGPPMAKGEFYRLFHQNGKSLRVRQTTESPGGPGRLKKPSQMGDGPEP